MMFVRVKKIGAYEYLYLVENAREGGRHVQRVVKRWNVGTRFEMNGAPYRPRLNHAAALPSGKPLSPA